MTGLACAGHDLINVNLRLLAKMIAFTPHHRALGSGKKTVDYMSRGFPENSEETVCASVSYGRQNRKQLWLSGSSGTWTFTHMDARPLSYTPGAFPDFLRNL